MYEEQFSTQDRTMDFKTVLRKITKRVEDLVPYDLTATVTAEADIRGGGTGREFCANIIDHGT